MDRQEQHAMAVEQNDAVKRLEELEARIEEKRREIERHGVLGNQLKAEWDDMLRRHAEIKQRIAAGHLKESEARATLELDIDVLKHAFFRWAARVDEHFKAGPKR
jgi:chromosome segregation ATPase